MKTNETTIRESRRISKKAVLLLISVFLLGLIIGIGSTVMITLQRLQNNLRNPEFVEGPADRVFKKIGNELENELDLTTEESKAVREELAKSRSEIKEIRIKLIQDIRRVAGESIDRIGSHLPESKQKALNELAIERLTPWGLEPTD